LGSEVIWESLTRYLFNSSGEVAGDFPQDESKPISVMVAWPQFFPSFRVRLNDETWRLETRPVNLNWRRWPHRKCLRRYRMPIFSSRVSHRHWRHTSIVSKATSNPLGIAALLFNHEMIMFSLVCGRETLLYDNEILASTAVFASYIKPRVSVIHC
jgi:hypothetical protein